jgi:hypothetical protein
MRSVFQFLLGFQKEKEEEEVVINCRLCFYLSRSLFVKGCQFELVLLLLHDYERLSLFR